MSVETSRIIRIKAEPLTPEAFAPYGSVIDAGRCQLYCNEGEYTARLMTLEPMPDRVGRINRHFDHTQLFAPITGDSMVLVVAPAHLSADGFDPKQIRAFVNDGTQAWTYNVGVWHLAPRALDGSTARVINVQGSRYLDYTELIDFETQTGTAVEVEL